MTLLKNKKDLKTWLETHDLESGLRIPPKLSQESLEKQSRYQKKWFQDNKQYRYSKVRIRENEIKQNTIKLRKEFFAEERERLKKEGRF